MKKMNFFISYLRLNIKYKIYKITHSKRQAKVINIAIQLIRESVGFPLLKAVTTKKTITLTKPTTLKYLKNL